MSSKGPRDWTVRVNYGGEVYYDIWRGYDTKEDVLEAFWAALEAAGEYWDWRTDGGVTRMRTAFIAGVEVFK